MAINIIHRPHSINPNSNLNTWVVNSDNPNLIYVLVEVIEPTSNGIITIKKVYPKPLQTNIQFNLSDVLKNVCESVLIPNNELITVTKLPSYKLKITEYVVDVNGNVIQGAVLNDSTINYFFESQEGIIDYVGYTSNKYNIHNGEDKAKFLTNDQTVKKITITQKEYLKIFNTNGIGKKALIQLYDTDGDFLESVTIGIPTTEGNVINLNMTRDVLLNHPSINEDTRTIVGQYKVTILSDTDVEVSESRLYIVYEDNCSMKETIIVYKNQLGGFDSVKFLNRVETVNVNKTYLNTSINKGITYSTDGKYLNNQDVIDTNVTTSYQAYSDFLSDYESKQIKQLLLSNKVYAVVGQFLVEITIDNKTYKVMQRHVNGGKKNRMDLNFTTPFSIDKLEEVINVNDIPLNNNPDPNYYLTVNGDFVVDIYGRYITLKY